MIEITKQLWLPLCISHSHYTGSGVKYFASNTLFNLTSCTISQFINESWETRLLPHGYSSRHTHYFRSSKFKCSLLQRYPTQPLSQAFLYIYLLNPKPGFYWNEGPLLKFSVKPWKSPGTIQIPKWRHLTQNGPWWVKSASQCIPDKQVLISLGKVKFHWDPSSFSMLSWELMGCSRWRQAELVCGIDLLCILSVNSCGHCASETIWREAVWLDAFCGFCFLFTSKCLCF